MPLDINFPTFHLAPVPREPHITTLSFTESGSEPRPVYTRTRDPQTPSTYAITLHDALFPDILYGSVRCHPEILPPSPSAPQDPPKILLPREFTINLFNPSSSVLVEFHHSTLRGSYWEFSLPKQTFFAPTVSALDSSNRHLAEVHIPRLTFRWRKEGGVLSRTELRCSLVSPGNLGAKKKAGAGEPDIPVAIFSGVGNKRGELMLYESNFRRVEVEDTKGMEVVLLLGAAVINEVWFCKTDVSFNLPPGAAAGKVVTAPPRGRKSSSPPVPAVAISPPPGPSGPSGQPQPQQNNGKTFADRMNNQNPAAARPSPARAPNPQQTRSPPPRQGPTPQQQAQLAQQRAAADRRIAEEQAQIRRMLAEEETRERQRRQARQAEIDRETARLKRAYDQERASTAMSMRRQSHPVPSRPQSIPPRSTSAQHRPTMSGGLAPPPAQRPPVVGGGGGGAYFGGGGLLRPDEGRRLDRDTGRRKSFLGLFGGDAAAKKGKLQKKGSSMF